MLGGGNAFPAILVVHGNRLGGWVRCQERKVIFSSADSPHQGLAWDEFSLVATISGNLVTLHSSVDPGTVIEISDRNFGKEIKAQLDIDLKSTFAHWWQRRPMLAGLSMTIFLVLVVILGINFLHMQGKLLANFVSQSQEEEIGRTAMKAEMQKVIELPAELSANWSALSSRILGLPSLKNISWKLYILKEESENAFALPGGIIAFNSGLILNSQSPDELLGILAHEAAHVRARHGIQSIAAQTSSGFLASIFFGRSNFMGSLVGLADSLTALEYSRAQEAQADQMSLNYLREAQISPRGFLDFFQRNEKKNKIEGWVSWISTHPMGKERIENIQKALSSDHSLPISFDLTTIKDYLTRQN